MSHPIEPGKETPGYSELPGRKTMSSIRGVQYEISVLKTTKADLKMPRRIAEGIGLLALTVGTVGLALLSSRVLECSPFKQDHLISS